jgi:hypothetical protein
MEDAGVHVRPGEEAPHLTLLDNCMRRESQERNHRVFEQGQVKDGNNNHQNHQKASAEVKGLEETANRLHAVRMEAVYLIVISTDVSLSVSSQSVKSGQCPLCVYTVISHVCIANRRSDQK